MNIIGIFVSLYFVFSTLVVTSSKTQHGNCREQDTAELLRAIKSPDPETLHPSFLLMSHFRQLTTTVNPKKSNHAKTFKVGEESGCRSAEALFYKNGGNICPSYHVIQFDPDRVPSTIVQTECSCKLCQRQRSDYRCEKDYTYSRVLRRAGCARNPVTGAMVMQYNKEWEAVSVSCSCRYQGR